MTRRAGVRLSARAPRCEMRGKLAAHWWNADRHPVQDRCPNAATWRSSGGSLFCDACRKHMREYQRSTIRLAQGQLDAIRTAKRLVLARAKRRGRRA